MQPTRCILAVEAVDFRDEVEKKLKAAGIQMLTLQRPEQLMETEIDGAIILLETGSKLLRMKRIATELYEKKGSGRSLPILAVAPGHALQTDPIGFGWVIGDHPALAAFIVRERQADIDRIPLYVERISAADGS